MPSQPNLTMNADKNPVPEPYDGSIDYREEKSKLVHALQQLELNHYREELEMQKKIKKMKDEYHAKRRAIITGAYVPTESECKYELADPTSTEPSEPKEKGIPYFWSAIFLNLRYFVKLCSNDDHKVMMHLVDVRCVKLDLLPGFRLEFEFSENEYFTNKVLSVVFYYKEDSRNPLQIDSMEGCTIDWKDGKDVTHTKEMMENPSKTIQALDGCIESFFDFFDMPTAPIDHPDVCKGDRKLILAGIKAGELLRDKVIPWAVSFFTGDKNDDDEKSYEDSEEGEDSGLEEGELVVDKEEDDEEDEEDAEVDSGSDAEEEGDEEEDDEEDESDAEVDSGSEDEEEGDEEEDDEMDDSDAEVDSGPEDEEEGDEEEDDEEDDSDADADSGEEMDEEEDSGEPDEDDDEMEVAEVMDNEMDSDKQEEDDEGEPEDESLTEPCTKKFKSDASLGEGAKFAN